MTVDEFRKMALSLPEALEAAHMGHADFRVRGKIFATLGYPAVGWGVVKLTPQQQKRLVDAQPDVYVPARGAWGFDSAARGTVLYLHMCAGLFSTRRHHHHHCTIMRAGGVVRLS